jgi:hypothetical protein
VKFLGPLIIASALTACAAHSTYTPVPYPPPQPTPCYGVPRPDTTGMTQQQAAKAISNWWAANIHNLQVCAVGK